MQDWQFWLLMFSLWYSTCGTMHKFEFNEDAMFSLFAGLACLGMTIKCLLF